MHFKQKVALLSTALTTFASAIAITTIVGHEVRLVELIALFAGGFGAGASVVATAVTTRQAHVRLAAEPEATDTTAPQPEV
ncbi:MAG TPA: hypothetical protein VFK45_05720 [Gammaproteobacteria bacterium]|nr:hypothetical protein [Gammaproteobacteria bacterium]